MFRLPVFKLAAKQRTNNTSFDDEATETVSTYSIRLESSTPAIRTRCRWDVLSNRTSSIAVAVRAGCVKTQQYGYLVEDNTALFSRSSNTQTSKSYSRDFWSTHEILSLYHESVTLAKPLCAGRDHRECFPAMSTSFVHSAILSDFSFILRTAVPGKKNRRLDQSPIILFKDSVPSL